MMAGKRPMANLTFSGQVSMSLFRRIARMPLLQHNTRKAQHLEDAGPHLCLSFTSAQFSLVSWPVTS